jgi:hypothetical protein
MKSKTSRSLTFVLLLLTGLALPSRASGAFVFTISPFGANVVVNGSGSFNLSGLLITVPSSSAVGPGVIAPGFAGLQAGSSPLVDEYRGFPVAISGPITFGSGGGSLSTSDFGLRVGIRGPSASGSGGALYLPTGYIAGTQLVSGSTYANHTLATLGLTPGSYVYTWGSDTLTVNIVPEPSSWSLLGCGVLLVGILFIRARRKEA